MLGMNTRDLQLWNVLVLSLGKIYDYVPERKGIERKVAGLRYIESIAASYAGSCFFLFVRSVNPSEQVSDRKFEGG